LLKQLRNLLLCQQPNKLNKQIDAKKKAEEEEKVRKEAERKKEEKKKKKTLEMKTIVQTRIAMEDKTHEKKKKRKEELEEKKLKNKIEERENKKQLDEKIQKGKERDLQIDGYESKSEIMKRFRQMRNTYEALEKLGINTD